MAIVRNENTRKSAATSGLFGIFGLREGEIFESWDCIHACDICGIEFKQRMFLGSHTGVDMFPILGMTEIKYGYKRTTAEICSSHTEKEIESFVEKQKEKS